MLTLVLNIAARIKYIGLAAVGMWMVLDGYPPPTSGLPVLLAIGGLFAMLGLTGMIWPDKMLSDRRRKRG